MADDEVVISSTTDSQQVLEGSLEDNEAAGRVPAAEHGSIADFKHSESEDGNIKSLSYENENSSRARYLRHQAIATISPQAIPTISTLEIAMAITTTTGIIGLVVMRMAEIIGLVVMRMAEIIGLVVIRTVAILETVDTLDIATPVILEMVVTRIAETVVTRITAIMESVDTVVTRTVVLLAVITGSVVIKRVVITESLNPQTIYIICQKVHP